MSNTREHEEHRWNYMTVDQLVRRLGKIKDPIKLTHFMDIAYERDHTLLLSMAINRAIRLGLNSLAASFERRLHVIENLPRPTPRRREELSRVQQAVWDSELGRSVPEATPTRDLVDEELRRFKNATGALPHKRSTEKRELRCIIISKKST